MSAFPKNSFDTAARIFKVDAEDQHEGGPAGDPIERAAAEYQSAMVRHKRASDALDHHEEAKDRAGDEMGLSGKASDAARDALIRAIIESDGRPLPSFDDWFCDSGPLWSVRAGGKLYVVTRSRDANHPDTVEEAVESAALVILDDPSTSDTPKSAGMRRAEDSAALLSELRDCIGKSLDCFGAIRASYLQAREIYDADTSDLCDADPGDPRDMRDVFVTIGRLDTLATDLAALACVMAGGSVQLPAPDANPEDWPIGAVIRRGSIFIGGRFHDEQVDPFIGAIQIGPGSVVDLDAAWKGGVL